MTTPSSQKIYAFVDESGQETQGAIFLVSVIVTDKEYEFLNQTLLEIEELSKKGQGKWNKTRFEYRLAYIDGVISRIAFEGLIYFSHFANSRAYFDMTVETTANAIECKNQENYPATVIVDGLSGRNIDRFKRGLRNRKINVRKVKGARDESEPLIRLADAIAGFIRDFLEGQEYAQKLYERARQDGIIQEI